MANDVLLITPDGGTQTLSETDMHSTLDAMASGASLTPQQQTVANIFASPASAGNPAPVLPKTTTAARDQISGFLRGLEAAPAGAPVGVSAQQASSLAAASPKRQTLDLQGLLLPGVTQAFTSGAAAQGPAVGASLGDQSMAEEVENMRLMVEKQQLRRQMAVEQLRNQVMEGKGYTAASQAKRLGIPAAQIGLRPDYYEWQAKNDYKAQQELSAVLTGRNQWGSPAGFSSLASPFKPTGPGADPKDIQFSSGFLLRRDKTNPTPVGYSPNFSFAAGRENTGLLRGRTL